MRLTCTLLATTILSSCALFSRTPPGEGKTYGEIDVSQAISLSDLEAMPFDSIQSKYLGKTITLKETSIGAPIDAPLESSTPNACSILMGKSNHARTQAYSNPRSKMSYYSIAIIAWMNASESQIKRGLKERESLLETPKDTFTTVDSFKNAQKLSLDIPICNKEALKSCQHETPFRGPICPLSEESITISGTLVGTFYNYRGRELDLYIIPTGISN